MRKLDRGQKEGRSFFQEIRPLKEWEVKRLEERREEILGSLDSLPPSISLREALSKRNPAVIAEIKRASPSKGVFAPKLEASVQAQAYQKAGASAVSVLTEPYFFKGSIEDLREVRKAVGLPLLRKDFILSELQIAEARIFGADSVLLIVGFLEDEKLLGSLLEFTQKLGMEALVEVHDENELYSALRCNARILGINNRNLKTLQVDLSVSERLLPLVPPEITVVVESGVDSPEAIDRLQKAGAKAFLIGEYLVRSEDPERALRELLCR